MPRPSVKKERTEEILNACQCCVARYGLEGATLERIAEESGLQRSLVRHYVGNRDDLIMAVLARFLDDSNRQMAELESYLPKADADKVLIDYLFDEQWATTNIALLGSALVVGAANMPALAAPLKKWADEFIESIVRILSQTYSQRTQDECRVVASGIVGIYFNVDSLQHLGDISELRKNSKHSAMILLASLD